MNGENEFILEMKNCRKEFPGVVALDDVSLYVKRGEVHALMGENGAGKSTIMKILAGIYTLDGGEILMNGEPFVAKSPADALQKGISMIYQELDCGTKHLRRKGKSGALRGNQQEKAGQAGAKNTG